MRSVLKILIVICVCYSNSIAQSTTWMRYYDPTGYRDVGIDVLQSSDSTYVFLSNTIKGICLIKTNLLGQIIWEKFLGDSVGSDSRSMCHTSDSGFVIAGQSASPINSAQLIKTDKEGNILWIKKYINAGRSSRAFSVKETFDKGFIMCGEIYPAAPNEVYIVKTNSLGNLQWERQYNGITTYDIIQSTNGNYYSIGFFVLRKIDSLGNEIWNRSIGSASKILQSSDGYLYTGGGSEQFYLAKIDTSGSIIFQRNYLTKAYGYGMCITGSGYIMIAGAILTDTGSVEVAFVKVNQKGSLIYTKFINIDSMSNEDAVNIRTTKDNGFIMTGTTDYPSGNELYYNILGIKTDSSGNTSPIVGINQNNAKYVNGFELYQNYPNPFNSTTIIKYMLNRKSFVKLSIYDINGKLLKLIVNNEQSSGEHKYHFNGSNLSSGIYFINLQTANYVNVKKMLLLK